MNRKLCILLITFNFILESICLNYLPYATQVNKDALRPVATAIFVIQEKQQEITVDSLAPIDNSGQVSQSQQRRIERVIEHAKGLIVELPDNLGIVDVQKLLKETNIFWRQAEPRTSPIEGHADARRNAIYLIANSLMEVSDLEFLWVLVEKAIELAAKQSILLRGDQWEESIAREIEKVAQGYIKKATAEFWRIRVEGESNSPRSLSREIGGNFGDTGKSRTEYILKEKLNLKGDEIICDIGSGKGDFCFAAAGSYPEATVIGAELSSGLVAMSTMRKIEDGFSNVNFINLNALSSKIDYSLFDVIYMYNPVTWDRIFYEKLTAKLAREMRPGARLVCFGLHFEDDPIDMQRGIIGGYKFPREIILKSYMDRFDFTYSYMGPGFSILEVYTKKPVEKDRVREVVDIKQISARGRVDQWLEEVSRFSPQAYSLNTNGAAGMLPDASTVHHHMGSITKAIASAA